MTLLHHGRALLLGLAIGVAYWFLFAALRPGVEVLASAAPAVSLAFDRLTAILEFVLPFALPVMGLALLGMCLGTHLRCRELRAELEAA
jgi:hypothetical protein